MKTQYKLLRIDRASSTPTRLEVGMVVYPGLDAYGCSSDDTRETGIDHTACSADESGIPFFTIPRADIERLT